MAHPWATGPEVMPPPRMGSFRGRTSLPSSPLHLHDTEVPLRPPASEGLAGSKPIQRSRPRVRVRVPSPASLTRGQHGKVTAVRKASNTSLAVHAASWSAQSPAAARKVETGESQVSQRSPTHRSELGHTVAPACSYLPNDQVLPPGASRPTPRSLQQLIRRGSSNSVLSSPASVGLVTMHSPRVGRLREWSPAIPSGRGRSSEPSTPRQSLRLRRAAGSTGLASTDSDEDAGPPRWATSIPTRPMPSRRKMSNTRSRRFHREQHAGEARLAGSTPHNLSTHTDAMQRVQQLSSGPENHGSSMASNATFRSDALQTESSFALLADNVGEADYTELIAAYLTADLTAELAAGDTPQTPCPDVLLGPEPRRPTEAPSVVRSPASTSRKHHQSTSSAKSRRSWRVPRASFRVEPAAAAARAAAAVSHAARAAKPQTSSQSSNPRPAPPKVSPTRYDARTLVMGNQMPDVHVFAELLLTREWNYKRSRHALPSLQPSDALRLNEYVHSRALQRLLGQPY